MLDTIVREGLVVSPVATFHADIGIEDGRIVKLANTIHEPADKTIDTRGRLVLPGGIDPHTHMNNSYEFFGSHGADGFDTGSISAACGGVTTFIDFARQSRGQSLRDCFNEWRREADPKVAVDYGIHLIITDMNDDVRKEIPAMIDSGVPSFKLYTTYRNALMVDDGAICDVMKTVGASGGLVGVHCENNDLVEYARRNYRPGASTFSGYVAPSLAEEEAVRRMILYATDAHCSMYVVHLSTESGLTAIRQAALAGERAVFAETCPHFLAFTDEVYSREDWALFTVTPPIRSKADQDALWSGLAAGEIKVVGSDHAGMNRVDKMRPDGDASKIPPGLASVEVILPILYSLGVKKNRISLNRMVEVTSFNPARLFGLYPRKGTIAVGSDADLVILDPKRSVRLSRENLHSAIDHSIYEDIVAEGSPCTTLLRGLVVFQDGQYVGQKGTGSYLPRGPPLFEP